MKTLFLVLALTIPAFAQADIHCVAHVGHHTFYSCEGQNMVRVSYPGGIPSSIGNTQLENTHRLSYIISEFKGLGYGVESCEVINEKAESICIFVKPE